MSITPIDDKWLEFITIQAPVFHHTDESVQDYCSALFTKQMKSLVHSQVLGQNTINLMQYVCAYYNIDNERRYLAPVLARKDLLPDAIRASLLVGATISHGKHSRYGKGELNSSSFRELGDNKIFIITQNGDGKNRKNSLEVNFF